jgi:isoleucyl-tRNA synthetase
MSKYKTTKQLNLPEIDQEVLAFWEANKVFEKSVSNREGKETYVFYEGPPSANGKPGIHHVMGRAIKDIFCRFNTMKGYQVNRKGGWDTHGLPIELQVEKELGITKEDIGDKISVDDYNKACRETVMRYKNLWDDITVKMGYWVDLDDPYVTFENNYIESVWWLLKRLYDKDLLYKGYTIQPFSPAAGTGLSTHELNQPGCYKNVKDTSAVAQFMVKRNEKSEFLYQNVGQEDVHFIAWTTTPWTLPSNTALAVGGKIDYVLVKTFNKYTYLPINIILAKSLFGKWFSKKNADLKLADYTAGDKNIPFETVGEFKGSELELIEYHQLLAYQQPEDGDAFKVLIGDFVSTEDGTGIVHLAPSFGADDKKVGDKYGIGSLTLVDKQGKFIDGVGEFSGRYVKNYKDDPNYVNVDVDISIKLKTENKAFDVKKYEHNYPHCWRTDKPILYYPLDSWFIKASSVKERMQELNNTINWKPKSTGEGRFGKWLENLQDWNLSRSRFWGIPLPIWRTKVDPEDSGENTAQLCIGSIEELGKEIAKANAALGLNQVVPKDMHRPYIDDVILVADDGRAMTRELDLIDVWFDSGAMPYAQWHYPFENKEKFEQNFPANFIAEGVDQTRGWFYTLHAIATMAFDSVAFKNVVSNGLVLDKNGVKMSKRLGNGIDPFETIEQHGADATRWYMISNSQPWDNLKFDPDGLLETRNKFFGTLYNTYQFFSVYANIDKFTYSEADIPMAERPEIDRWVLSLLNTLVKDVTADLSDYEPTNATRKIQEFVGDHLSNWYVRLCRRRFWKGEYEADKISAYQTLYTCMETIAKLMSPVAPFYSDKLFRDLNDVTGRNTAISVHLTDFPVADESLIDKALEESMDYAQRISSLILSLRKKNTLRVRQPLQKILLPVLNEGFITQVDSVKDLILQEVNVKEIEYVTDTSGIIKKGVKPNFSTLGRRLGKNMKAGKALIEAMTQEDIANLEAAGKFPLVIDGETFELEMEDFVITSEDLEGWLVANDKDLTVALDVHISDELKAEGMAREIVNRIQNLRKDSGFEVTDKINITIENHEAIRSAVELFGEYIKAEVLGESLVLAEGVDGEVVDLIDEVVVRILVGKV